MARGSPEWLQAKPLLEQDYASVEGIENMSLDDVINLRPGVYGKVKRSNFANNWKAMKERLKKEKDKPAQVQNKISGPTSWEIAKPLLEEDYISGKATAAMTVDQVINLRKAIYGKVPRTNFASNWRALKIRVDGDKDRAKKDRERYDNDTGSYLLAKDLPWEWHGSEAERLLKVDVAKGRHDRYHPEILFYKRPEYYEDFGDYQKFRKHVHQEARSALESPYWMVQKEKKDKKKKEIQEGIKKALEEQQMYELENAFEGLSVRF